eukprot:TRINITY_DN3861_c0_g1_i4.p2 TRINITY_DN3861_c0_g1~~TRINITY_DN3861_c0_g1_i4.p2  ORF type:complete len:220 (-),score=66.62 TRINITY_DN3861_c0_g1_i4:51-710(-)
MNPHANPQMMQYQQQYQQQQMFLQQQQQMQYLAQQQPPQGHWFSHYYAQCQQQQLMQFGQWFMAIDKNRDGSLTATELTSICFNNKNITIGTATCLLKAFDLDYSNAINFGEYVCLHSFVMQVQQAFVAADADRSGRIDMREITSALANIGFTLEPAAVQTLMLKFDSTKTANIDFEAFLAMGAYLAHCKTIFEHYAHGQPAMTINFHQLASIGTHILP